MEQYASVQQLLKKEEGRDEKLPIYPPTVIQAVHDAKTGAPLESILAQYNSVYIQYQGNPKDTRNIIPQAMRRAGLTITYMNMNSETITERANSSAQMDNDHWGLDTNWSRIDELSLSGDISVSVNGTWIINGEDTGIKAVGPKGDSGITPWLKTIDNKLHYSYDNITWEECSENIAAWFRWKDNKIQISRDNKNWVDLTGKFTDNFAIKGYVASYDLLPSSASQGDIYGVGPTYAESDTEHTNPIYRYYVRNANSWVDNGSFNSISAGVVQETGNSETEVMSQKATTEKLTELASEFVKIKNDVSDIQASLPQNDYYAILESGVIYGDDGKDGDSDTAIRCRNYIPITSDPTVVITKNSYSANFGKRFYDDEKRYLGTTYSNDATYLRFSIQNTTMADEPDIVITIDGNEYAHFVYQKVATKQKHDEVDRRLSSIEVQVPNINGRLLDVESLTNTYQEPQEVLSAYVSNENLAEDPNWTTVIAKVNPNQTVRLVSQSIDTIRYVIYSDKPSIGDNFGIMVGSMVTGSVTAEIPNNLPSYYIAFSIWSNIETEPNIHIDGSIWKRPNIDERVTDLEELTESSIEPQEVLSAYVSNENILEYSYWTTVIAKVKPNQTVTLASHSVDSIRYMLYSKKPSIGDNSAITVGSMVTGSSSAQIPNILPFYYIAFSIQVNKNLEQGIHIDGNIWVNPNLKERVTDLEELIADTEDEISSLTDAFERFLPKLDYGDLLYNKCPNFVNAMRNKKKDVTVCLTGTSLTQGNLYVSQRDDRMERPPLMQGNDLASAVFDTLIKLWPGQKYRRFDHPSVIRSSSTWVDSATNAIWDDSGQKKNGYTGRTLDANAYISITVPSDAWRFNFIYRTDSEGGTCTVSIAEGNNKMEVFNGMDWVEANGYTFSMLEPAPTSTKGNTCYQKRLNMRCKNNASGGINSIGTTKALTITKENNNTTSFNVVGFEWSPREFMLTVINGARGGHCWGYQTEISVPETNNLEKYQDLDIWEFNPDLILCEVTAINWAAGSQRAIAYDPNWFVNLAKRHYYNEFEDCPISLYEKSNGYQDCEVVFYGDTLSIAGTNGDVWDENGNPVFGTVVNAASNGNTDNTNIGRVKTGVENYDAVDSYMASKNQLFIPITERIIDFAQKVYGSYPNAFAESRAKGNTLSYDETHLNDRGVRLWSSFIIPLFNF